MIKKLLPLLLALCLIILPASAETLKLYYGSEQVSETFRQTHPNLSLVPHSGTDYNNSYQMLAALLTQEFDYDLFKLGTDRYNAHQIMDKGYCADLSGSQVISEAVSKLHPAIAAQIRRDGKIYAFPDTIFFHLHMIDPQGWAAAGMREQDVPGSYSELLDFLESWCGRVEAQPEADIRVISRWDESLYGPASYTEWLVELLVQSHLMQSEYAGLPLRFDDERFYNLLVRTKEVGEALYQAEPRPNAEYQLIQESGGGIWPDKAGAHLISMRLDDSQPKLIQATISQTAVYARSQNQALATQMLEDLISQKPREDSKQAARQTMLYADAQPVRNADFEESLENTRKRIADFQAKLADQNLSVGDRNELENNLMQAQSFLENDLMKREYHISPEQLADYQSHVDGLFFMMPGPFVPSTDTGQNLRQLQSRYAAGAISAKVFVQDLDRIARMVELENGD